MNEPLLSVRGITAGYGDLTVLHEVSLDVAHGEIVSVVGANGAGKTTLLSVLARQLATTAGSIRFGGEDLRGVASHEVAARGLVLVPEGRKLFPFLTVEENLRLGAYHPVARGQAKQTLAEMYDLFPRLAERRRQNAGSLSGGEQQMGAIARGLMALPQLLMLDEPSLGLAPIVVEKLFELITGLPARGLSVLLVEQNVVEALALSSRGSVLDQGRVILTAPAQDLLNDPQLRHAYFGAA